MVRVVIVVVGAGLVSTHDAVAAPEPETRERVGQVAFGLDYGLLKALPNEPAVVCSGNSSGGNIGVHIGGMAWNEVALLVELSEASACGYSNGEGGADPIRQTGAIAEAAYWLVPRVWVGGGLGLGFARTGVSGYASPQTGLAFAADAGVEVVSHEGFALVVRGRWMRGIYFGDHLDGLAATPGGHIDTFALSIGLDWYFGGQ